MYASVTAARGGLREDSLYPKGFDAVEVATDAVFTPEAEAVRVGSGAAGDAATRIEALVISGGIRAYGGDPDIDALFRDQAVEIDRRRREALLHKIQQLMYERAMFAPNRRAGGAHRRGAAAA